MAELQQFLQQVKDAGGIGNIASVAAAIQAAGGVQQFNAQLSQVNALSNASGGPQQLAAHLQGIYVPRDLTVIPSIGSLCDDCWNLISTRLGCSGIPGRTQRWRGFSAGGHPAAGQRAVPGMQWTS